MSLTSLLGIDLPVIQAPMAGAQDEKLALAVANAGGLGSMPCALLDAAALHRVLQQLTSASRAINLNFFCHAMAPPDPLREQRWRAALAPYYREFGIEPPSASSAAVRRPVDEAIVAVLEPYRPKVLSFHFGLPDPPLLARMRAWGATILASATTLDEGLWLERHGVDAVIAQGIDAGGHRGHFLSPELGLQGPTRTLVTQFVRALRVPVIAAGGIGDHADVHDALSAGASAVQAGTAYLRCAEARTSSVHRAALADPARETDLTRLFTGRPARGIRNRLMRQLGPLSDLAPDFPWASPALAPLKAKAEAIGRDDFSALWCGTRPRFNLPLDAASVTRRLAGVA